MRTKEQKGLFFLESDELMKKIFEEEEEEVDEEYLVYQPLVYPPGTTPPTPQFTKRMNFVDFNLIL